MFTRERPHYSLALFSSFIYTCTFSKKIEFASKRPSVKSPGYANYWVKRSVIHYNIRATLCARFCDVITRVRYNYVLHPTGWAVTFTVSALTAICDDKPIISIFRIFLRKVIESSFWCKFISMRWSCVTKAYYFLKIIANCVASMLFHCFYDS